MNNIYFLADAITTGAAGFSVFLILILGLIGFILLVCWIAFPFIVLSKFNELLKVTRKIARYAEQSDAALTSLKGGLNETNKALQYLVDTAGLQRGETQVRS